MRQRFGGLAPEPPPRLPFSAVDETADLLERRGEPNVILLELAVGGRLDEARLRTAVRDALGAHPMARARKSADGPWHCRSSWEIPAAPDLDPLTVAAPGALRDDERRRAMDTAVPLGLSPLLRMRLLPGGDGDRLLVVTHHALFDAISCLGLVTSVIRRYNGEPDPVPEADPGLARTLPSPAPAPVRAQRARPARPVRVARVATAGAEGYGCVLHALGAAHTQALATGARRQGATVNDLLITGLALALARWNREHGGAVAPLRITMPINARPEGSRFEGISNLSRLTSIDIADSQDPRALLARVAHQTRLAKRTQAPAGGPAALLLGAPRLPYAVRRSLVPVVRTVARRYADTTMLSNLGRLPALPSFDGAGPITHLWMAAPAPMPRGLSVSALTVDDRLHLAVRHRRAVLDTAAATAFTGRLVAAFAELAELPAASEQLPI
ncbi:hypothetical protein ABZ746_03440 [Streptomyces sp. NPDC020096]